MWFRDLADVGACLPPYSGGLHAGGRQPAGCGATVSPRHAAPRASTWSPTRAHHAPRHPASPRVPDCPDTTACAALARLAGHFFLPCHAPHAPCLNRWRVNPTLGCTMPTAPTYRIILFTIQHTLTHILRAAALGAHCATAPAERGRGCLVAYVVCRGRRAGGTGSRFPPPPCARHCKHVLAWHYAGNR
mgnify:CR=1 FL=1